MNESKLFDVVFSTYLRITSVIADAEEQKPPKLRNPPNLFFDLNISGFVAERKHLIRVRRNHTFFKNIQVLEGDLRDCVLQFCEFKNCQFGASVQIEPGGEAVPVDLSGTVFSTSVFDAVIFGAVNISGVDFESVLGLENWSLSECIYDFDNPPQKLPSGILLKHPFFRREDPSKKYNETNIVDLDASSIAAFCNAHEGFEPYGEDQIITVEIEESEDN